MTSTDILVILLLCIFFWMGWRKGFLHSAIDPVCFIISSIFAIVYFDVSQNLFFSLSVAIIGTIASVSIIKLSYGLAKRTVDKRDRDYVFFPSRLVGAALSLTWQGLMLVLVVVVVSTLPPSEKLKYIQEDISRSYSYRWANVNIIARLPAVRNTKETLEALTDPYQLNYLRSLAEFQNLYNHKVVQDALHDPETMQQIKDKDIAKLLENPKFKELVSNKYVMKDFTKFSKKVYQMKAEQHKTITQQP